jgi:hypothetical protein
LEQEETEGTEKTTLFSLLAPVQTSLPYLRYRGVRGMEYNEIAAKRRKKLKRSFVYPLQYVRIAPFGEDFTTDGTDDTDFS